MPRMTLKILGRDYLFNVSEDDSATLQAAADLINSRAQRLHTADTKIPRTQPVPNECSDCARAAKPL